jgi:hypothetical protein
MMLYIKHVVPLSASYLWGVGRCQNWFWGEIIVSREIFRYVFFWPKTPALNISHILGAVKLSVLAGDNFTAPKRAMYST